MVARTSDVCYCQSLEIDDQRDLCVFFPFLDVQQLAPEGVDIYWVSNQALWWPGYRHLESTMSTENFLCLLILTLYLLGRLWTISGQRGRARAGCYARAYAPRRPNHRLRQHLAV